MLPKLIALNFMTNAKICTGKEKIIITTLYRIIRIISKVCLSFLLLIV